MSGGADDRSSPVTFNYIKSKLFRVVHVDGAIGGVTPRGLIHCSIYSERVAIPRVTQHEVDSDGTLRREYKVIDAREGIAREMEVDLILDERAALELRNWLDLQIAKLARLSEAERKNDPHG